MILSAVRRSPHTGRQQSRVFRLTVECEVPGSQVHSVLEPVHVRGVYSVRSSSVVRVRV